MWTSSTPAGYGRIYADGRTIEYIGRGNHSNDAFCVHTRESVGEIRQRSREIESLQQDVHSPFEKDNEPKQQPQCMEPTQIPLFYYEANVLATQHNHRSQPLSITTVTNTMNGIRHEEHKDEEQTEINEDQEMKDVEPFLPVIPPTSSNTMGNLRQHLVRSHIMQIESRIQLDTTSQHESSPSSHTRYESLSRDVRRRETIFPLNNTTVQQRTSRPSTSPSSGSYSSASSSSSSTASSPRRRRRSIISNRRANHQIAIGFTYRARNTRKCMDLGTETYSIALIGRTGAIVSKGHEYVPANSLSMFGISDTVGCGLILDTQTFFWTVNGVVVAKVPASHIPHLDFEEKWMDDLYPSMSLHESHECVTVHVDTTLQPFRFDLAAFQVALQEHRQRILIEYEEQIRGKMEKNGEECGAEKEENAIHSLIRNYMQHYGYEEATKAMDHRLKGAQHKDSGSLPFRHQVRRLIYSYQTRQALELVEKTLLKQENQSLIQHCHFLCVVDVLCGDSSLINEEEYSEQWCQAIRQAQELLVIPEQNEKWIKKCAEFMSALLLYRTRSDYARPNVMHFFSWSFREEVADQVNMAILSEEEFSHCSQEMDSKRRKTDAKTSHEHRSELETFLQHLMKLQTECIKNGIDVFPNENLPRERDHLSRETQVSWMNEEEEEEDE